MQLPSRRNPWQVSMARLVMVIKNSVVVLALWVGLLISSVYLVAQNAADNISQNQSQNQKVVQLSSDCTVKNLPQGFSRIFIALNPAGSAQPASSGGSGTLSDPYDGSTAEKFDGILRSRSEANQQNLIVCIGPGTFQTEGTYDFIVNLPH